MKPLGDGFIALLRMMLAPIIFCSVVLGLTHVADMRQLGRLSLKALIYFEGMTTVAMALGFVAVNVVQPGVGLHATNLAMGESISKIAANASHFTAIGFFLSIIPSTMVDAFATVYASSKWAINCFVQSLRRQVFRYGIRLGSISPGPVISALLADWPPEKLKEAKESGSLSWSPAMWRA